MGQVPVVVFVVPVVGLILVVLVPRFGKRMMASTDERYAEYRLASLAKRMGLQIVEGDPAINVMQAHVTHNMAGSHAARGLAGWIKNEKETRIRLEGAPYGRPTQFRFFARTVGTDVAVARFVSKELDCRLSLRVGARLPPFEIVLRHPGYGLKTRPELGLPPQSFGDPDLDRRFILGGVDPRLGPALAPVVAGLAGHGYVHIQGQGDVITSRATEPAMMSTILALVETQLALEHMANVFTGPVAPRR
jgi:hypothetical protein